MSSSSRNIPSLLFVMLAGVVAALSFGEALAEGDGKYKATFNADGELIRPAGWREWVFVGSPLTPNSLNGGEAPFPEFHSVYIDPKSWAHYKKTGTFREGTMFAKELTLVGATAATSGVGFFNGDLQGFEIAHKDSKKYSRRIRRMGLLLVWAQTGTLCELSGSPANCRLCRMSHGGRSRGHGFHAVLPNSKGCQRRWRRRCRCGWKEIVRAWTTSSS